MPLLLTNNRKMKSPFDLQTAILITLRANLEVRKAVATNCKVSRTRKQPYITSEELLSISSPSWVTERAPKVFQA
jgi:hypothetical protein